MPKNGAIYTRKAIAEILELSEKRVSQLTDSEHIKEFSPGHYKLLPAIRGYIRFLKSQMADGDGTSDYNTEKARLTKAKREDAELDLRLRKNELHEAADIEFIMTNMLIAFKAKLETLPYKVLPSVMNIPEDKDKAEYLVGVLKAVVDEALNEFADYSPELFNEEAYLERLDDTHNEAVG